MHYPFTVWAMLGAGGLVVTAAPGWGQVSGSVRLHAVCLGSMEPYEGFWAPGSPRNCGDSLEVSGRVTFDGRSESQPLKLVVLLSYDAYVSRPAVPNEPGGILDITIMLAKSVVIPGGAPIVWVDTLVAGPATDLVLPPIRIHGLGQLPLPVGTGEYPTWMLTKLCAVQSVLSSPAGPPTSQAAQIVRIVQSRDCLTVLPPGP